MMIEILEAIRDAVLFAYGASFVIAVGVAAIGVFAVRRLARF